MVINKSNKTRKNKHVAHPNKRHVPTLHYGNKKVDNRRRVHTKRNTTNKNIKSIPRKKKKGLWDY